MRLLFAIRISHFGVSFWGLIVVGITNSTKTQYLVNLKTLHSPVNIMPCTTNELNRSETFIEFSQFTNVVRYWNECFIMVHILYYVMCFNALDLMMMFSKAAAYYCAFISTQKSSSFLRWLKKWLKAAGIWYGNMGKESTSARVHIIQTRCKFRQIFRNCLSRIACNYW